MLRKQLQGLGVPVWERKLAEEQQCQAAPTGPGAAPLASPLRLWLITSDGVSDQMKFRRVMKLETKTNVSAIVVDATWVRHSGALVFRSGLVLIDNWLQRVGAPFKYYSSLAKLMHIWRDNARQVFLSWLARFGAVEAVRHAKRMPPRCIAGRWGSISVVENLLLEAGQDQVQSVFPAFFGHRICSPLSARRLALEDGAPSAALEDPPAGNPELAQQQVAAMPNNPDDIAIEATAAHRLRMGRWKAEA